MGVPRFNNKTERIIFMLLGCENGMANERHTVPQEQVLAIGMAHGHMLDVRINERSSSQRVRPRFYLVDVNKPYLINPNQIECGVGEWDKDKTRYGVRIFFTSGNSVWCEEAAARDIISELLWGKDKDDDLASSDCFKALEKFDAAKKKSKPFHLG